MRVNLLPQACTARWLALGRRIRRQMAATTSYEALQLIATENLALQNAP